MTKPRKTRKPVQKRSKQKRVARALRSTSGAQEILKQPEAYEPRKARAPQGEARGAPARTRNLQHPMEVAAQHWMQALMLPWAGWTALGAMMMNWPFAQMRLGAAERSDEKRGGGGRSKGAGEHQRPG